MNVLNHFSVEIWFRIFVYKLLHTMCLRSIE